MENQKILKDSSVYPEPNTHHNALRQLSVSVNGYTLLGFSISGLSSYLQVPELDLCFDMGECPISAVPLNHVFLTHAHGDHSRCLMRHKSLRKMIGIEKPAAYYLPASVYAQAKEWIRAEAAFEGVSDQKFLLPEIIPVNAGEWQPLLHRPDLIYKAFPVRHSLPSLGFTIATRKRKLKEEYLGLPSKEIIQLKTDNVDITREVIEPHITYIGDCLGESLIEQESIWASPILVLECTFLDDDEQVMARKKAHTHIDDIVKALEQFGDTMLTQHIVLKHFSMKYSRKHILKTLEKKIPERFLNHIIALI